jgi:hypothetical protein
MDIDALLNSSNELQMIDSDETTHGEICLAVLAARNAQEEHPSMVGMTTLKMIHCFAGYVLLQVMKRVTG